MFYDGLVLDSGIFSPRKTSPTCNHEQNKSNEIGMAYFSRGTCHWGEAMEFDFWKVTCVQQSGLPLYHAALV